MKVKYLANTDSNVVQLSREIAREVDLTNWIKFEWQKDAKTWDTDAGQWVKNPSRKRKTAPQLVASIIDAARTEGFEEVTLEGAIKRTVSRVETMSMWFGDNGSLNGNGTQVLAENEACLLAEALTNRL